MCPGTESALRCYAVTRETEADVWVQRVCVCVFLCLVAGPFGLMRSTAIAYLQPKPTGTVKIMSNGTVKIAGFRTQKLTWGISNSPAENSAWWCVGHLHLG